MNTHLLKHSQTHTQTHPLKHTQTHKPTCHTLRSMAPTHSNTHKYTYSLTHVHTHTHTNTCLRDAIEIALELRETPEMIHFRETMDRIDNSINEGNVLLINYLKQQLDDIIEQFIRKEIPTEKTPLSFSITPSFTAPTFSVEFGIPTGSKTSKHRINLNFITNLVKHGLTKTYRGDLNI